MKYRPCAGPILATASTAYRVINNTKYGYDAVGNLLRLTLLRSPKWPDPDADMGHQHFQYALYPHAGTWKDAMTVRHGYEYNYPLTAVVDNGSLRRAPGHALLCIRNAGERGADGGEEG